MTHCLCHERGTRFSAVPGSTPNTSDDGGEMVLAAFGGTCCNCQEKGHRANQCPKKTGPNNGNHSEGGNTRGKFSGTYNHCIKIGHKKSSCWQLDENKNKRPKNFRGVNAEHANALISSEGGDDGNAPESLMCALCYDEEEGSADMDHVVCVFDGIEEEKIEFVNENDEETFNVIGGYEEEESEGVLETIKDFEYHFRMNLLLNLRCAQ
jgi:hypothetical protein